jgi:chloramphenicol O-acetyltransferase type B
MISSLRSLRFRLSRWYYTRQVKKQCAAHGAIIRVGGPSYVTKKTWLGTNVNFNGMGIAGNGKVVIGDNFHSGRNCSMLTSYHNYDHGTAIPYDSTYIHKDIIIEDNVWLGQGVTILGGVTVGEGAIIQAGSVIVKSIPKYAIAGGHPAVAFKYRNIEHYERLKAEGKFH